MSKSASLEQRLIALEKQNRWYKLTMFVGTLILCSVFVIGTASQRDTIIEAQQFILKDEFGTERAVLGILQSGQAGLFLFDSNGKRTTSLNTSLDGTSVLGFHSASGEGRLLLSSDHGLFLYDSTGSVRAMLYTKENGEPILSFYDSNHKKRIDLSVVDTKEESSANGPVIILHDPNEKERVFLAVTGYYGDPMFSLMDSQGRPLFHKP